MWKHAIITGGSSGIGKEIAKLLAGEGSNISIIARNSRKLEAVVWNTPGTLCKQRGGGFKRYAHSAGLANLTTFSPNHAGKYWPKKTTQFFAKSEPGNLWPG